MKTSLLASTALVLSVGAAAAADFTMADTGHDHSITLAGDARMGVINEDNGDGLRFTSRARVQFNGAGETDGGVGFGFSFRADNAGGAANGTGGSVFISQGGHTLAMGDVDSAANAAVGQVSGVGLTGLGDLNEVNYDLNDAPGDGDGPALLYSYSSGAIAFHLSVDNEHGDGDLGQGLAMGVAYDAGTFNVAFGVESDDDDDTGVFVGVGVDVGSVALHGIMTDTDDDGEEWAVSAEMATGATTFTVFAADTDGSTDWGLGASHDLGGGASLVAGIAHNESVDETAYDFGISMKF